MVAIDYIAWNAMNPEGPYPYGPELAMKDFYLPGLSGDRPSGGGD
jgi:hypothetical protein